jgi:hypothetical protein
MQFTVPDDQAERSPKGVGSMEVDRRSAFGAKPSKLLRDISLFDYSFFAKKYMGVRGSRLLSSSVNFS